MDDLKCKKGSRSKEAVMKKRKKVRKKTRKKQKENGKLERNFMDQILSQIVIFVLLTANQVWGKVSENCEQKQKLEGMFFKGLRSEFITREALNEHNEARKNEDLHKIIDIGRDYLQKVQRPVRCTKRITGCSDNRKPKKSSHDLREVSTEGIENFEQCSLSPISFVTSLPESDRSEEGFEMGRLILGRELEKFALNYEEAVEAQILLRLPHGGVLEDALRALRKTEENEKFLEEETTFLDELKFGREEQEMPGAEDFIENFAFPKKFPTPESHYNDTFNEKPLENLLIMTDVKAEDYNHPSFTASFYNDDEKDPQDQFCLGMGFKTSVRDLTIVTPPIRFYRRNMF